MWQGQRYFFPRSLQSFVQAENPFDLWQQDGEGGSREEYIMLRLRLTQGLDLAELATLWPRSAQENEYLRKQIPPLVKAGLAKLEGDRFSLTKEGFLVSNGIISRLV